jgi:hypothetical protein
MVALVLVLISIITYCSSTAYNSVTGEDQHISLTVDQEIALGLQAVPQMAAEFGGLDPNQAAQASVDKVGERLGYERRSETPISLNSPLADNENQCFCFTRRTCLYHGQPDEPA